MNDVSEKLNDAFFFVVDKIIDLQEFFIGQAWAIGRVVLLIAVLSAGLNYALTGTGLKENTIKILKATLFFVIIIGVYPRIIGFISTWTFQMARDSIYPSVVKYYNTNRDEISRLVDETVDVEIEVVSQRVSRDTFLKKTIKEVVPGNPDSYFLNLITEMQNTQSGIKYSAVPPAAVFRIILLIAGDCIKYANGGKGVEFGRTLIGLICAFFIILTGAFAVLEYIMAFMEFMLVASVGVILFPLSIWEGSKFMAEKFIGAILGFFLKLLFCNIAIFLLIYGFITLAYQFSTVSFAGQTNQIIEILFICLLFFYICKSAPGLAQSLLSGTPSLSATGAISAVGGAVAAAGATLGLAKSAGVKGGAVAGKVAGGVANTALAAHGALSEASAASHAVRDAGGSKGDQRGAYWSSMGQTAKDALSATGLGLVRSITGGGNKGANPHSWREDFNSRLNEKGEQQSLSDHYKARRAEGKEEGLAHFNKSQTAKQQEKGKQLRNTLAD